MRLKQPTIKLLSFLSCPECRVQDSLPYRRVLTTQALYTCIFMCSVSVSLQLQFVQTVLVSLESVAAAFPMCLLKKSVISINTTESKQIRIGETVAPRKRTNQRKNLVEQCKLDIDKLGDAPFGVELIQVVTFMALVTAS